MKIIIYTIENMKPKEPSKASQDIPDYLIELAEYPEVEQGVANYLKLQGDKTSEVVRYLSTLGNMNPVNYKNNVLWPVFAFIVDSTWLHVAIGGITLMQMYRTHEVFGAMETTFFVLLGIIILAALIDLTTYIINKRRQQVDDNHVILARSISDLERRRLTRVDEAVLRVDEEEIREAIYEIGEEARKRQDQVISGEGSVLSDELGDVVNMIKGKRAVEELLTGEGLSILIDDAVEGANITQDVDEVEYNFD